MKENNNNLIGENERESNEQIVGVEVVRKESRNEVVEREYADVLNKRELQYDMDVESDPSRKDLRQALNMHNSIVSGYANQLSEMNNELSAEDKVAVVIATIYHDCGKLNSGLLDHHEKGVEYADGFIDDLIDTDIEGVKITPEIKRKALEAIERHMNHPFLVMLKKGERFPEPIDAVDKIVFDADMLANIGFKNVAFRLSDENFFNQDYQKAQQNGTTVLGEMIENVLNKVSGAGSINNVVLTKEAKIVADNMIKNVDDIYEKMKNDGVLLKIQQEIVGVDGDFNYQTVKSGFGANGVSMIKKRLEEEIINSARELNISDEIVINILL